MSGVRSTVRVVGPLLQPCLPREDTVMSQALNNAVHRARQAEHNAHTANYEQAVVELARAVKELVADNKRLEREFNRVKPRSGHPVY